MEKSLMVNQTTDEPAWFQEQFQQSLAEMDHLHSLMAQDQTEIDLLAATSRDNLAEIKALSDQTEAMLATLKAS
jgi:hypothetical protein